MTTATYETYRASSGPPAEGLFAAQQIPDDAPDIFDDEYEEEPEAETGGDSPSGVVVLRDYQQAALDATLGEFRRKVQGTLNVMATGTGKCLGRDTPVLLFDGSIKMAQDVQAGDMLIGPDSKPRRVLSTTKGVGPLYKVTPTKGDAYVVNDAHILSLKCTANHSAKYRKGAITNISVADYVKQSATFKHMMKGWRTGTEWQHRPVALEPYFLGLWMGDGHSYSQAITAVDPECIAYLADYAERLELSLVCYAGKSDWPQYSIAGQKGRANPVRDALRQYDLLQNKHIPQDYKANSRQVRLELLAGIIDADGSASCGGYDIIFKSRQLASDTVFVARSLGFAAYVKPSRKTCNGKVFDCWRLFISGDVSEIPVRVARRAVKPRRQKKNVLLTGIAVESIGIGEYFGFEIDGDRLFLLGDFTVTHNSVILASLAKWANDHGHGVLILVHRDELIRQLVKSCSRCGVLAGVEKAQERARGGYPHFWNTVVASVQTLKGRRLEEWPRDAFKLVIVDEAHHCLMKNSYGRVLSHFGYEEGRIKVAGFTATADRLDGQNVGQVFETLAYEYNIRDATRDGWLVPIEALQLKTDPPIDLSDLRLVAGDFNQGDLEREIQENIGVLVNSIADTGALEDRRTIAFTPNIASAHALAAALCDVGIQARGVAGDSADRHEIFAGHQRGDFQVLVNCMIATEGYDDPAVSAILMCRPTKSRALYSQMVGRGTRLYEGKTNCRVVDFAFMTGKHQLVSPVDLYDNSETADEVVAKARDLMAQGEFTGIEEALEAAQNEYDNERRVRIQRRMVAVQATKFDPLAACEIYGIPRKADYEWSDAQPATEKQVNALQKWGIHIEGFIGKGTASKLLNKIFARHEHGWAAPRSVAKLIESGLDPDTATGMRETQARDYLAANPLGPTEKQAKFLRWKGVSDAEIAAMTRKDASARISAIKESEGA